MRLTRRDFLKAAGLGALSLAFRSRAPEEGGDQDVSVEPISILRAKEITLTNEQREMHRLVYLKLAYLEWRGKKSNEVATPGFTSGVITDINPGTVLTHGGTGESALLFYGDLYDNSKMAKRGEAVKLFAPNLRFIAYPVDEEKALLRFMEIRETPNGKKVEWPLRKGFPFDEYNLAVPTENVQATKLLVMGLGNDRLPQHRYFEVSRGLNPEERIVGLGVHQLPVGAGVFSVEDKGILGLVTKAGPGFIDIARVVFDAPIGNKQ